MATSMSAAFRDLSTALLRSIYGIRFRATALLLVLLAAGLAATPEARGDAFDYRKPITIDRNKVGTTGAPTTLTKFPMLYSVTDPNLKTVANGGRVQNANGWDIIFRAVYNDPVGTDTCLGGRDVP